MIDPNSITSVLALASNVSMVAQTSQNTSNSSSTLSDKFQFSNVLKSSYGETADKTYSEIRKPKNLAESSDRTNTVPTNQNTSNNEYDDDFGTSENINSDYNSTHKSETNPNQVYENSHSGKQPADKLENNQAATPNDHNRAENNNARNTDEVLDEKQPIIAIQQNSQTLLADNPLVATLENSQQDGPGSHNQTTSQVVSPLNIAAGQASQQSETLNPHTLTALRVQEVATPEVKAATTAATPKVSENTQSGLNGSQVFSTAQKAQNVNKASSDVTESSGQVISKTAGESASSGVRDIKTSQFGEDLNKPELRNIKEGITDQKAPSSGNASANKQEQDLSNRLKNNSLSPVKVSVNNSNANKPENVSVENFATKMNAMPSHTKAPIAELAEISQEDAQSSLPKASTGKTSSAVDTKTPNSHSIVSNTNTTAQSQQENAIINNQILRQQTAALGAQQSASGQSAMASKASTTADIPNIAATAGPNGPNQTQQVTKAVAPPPPPPPKPPVPIDQVAVQIKKAIGEGIDKINIKLKPAHLGNVEVKMEIAKDGQLTANIIAERPETLELLQRDVRGLEKALQDGGLKIDTQSFNFNLKENAQQQAADGREQMNEQQDNNNQNNNTNNDDDGQSMAPQAAAYGQNIATNGGVDIRV